MKDKLSASKKNKKIIKLLALYFTVFQNFLEFTMFWSNWDLSYLLLYKEATDLFPKPWFFIGLMTKNIWYYI